MVSNGSGFGAGRLYSFLRGFIHRWVEFRELSTARYQTNTHTVAEPFGNITLTTSTADIAFALANDEKCRVECYEEENEKHQVTVENNTLVIKAVNTKSWYHYIGLYFGSPKITVYLPKAEYNTLLISESTGSIKIPNNFAFANANISLSTGNADFGASVLNSAQIKTSTGNILVENTSVGALNLSATTGKVTVLGVTCRKSITVGVSTGKTELTRVTCKSLTSNGTTGSLFLNRVTAADSFFIKRSTGDITFSSCDAAALKVKTSTGNVTGSLRTPKIFITNTKTGSVRVPKTASGGTCEIGTGTGNIEVKLAEN